MKILQDYSISELKEIIQAAGEKPFRANQLFLNLSKGKKISEMTDLPLSFRRKLLEEYADEPCRIIKEIVSKEDGTKKFLFAFSDGNVVEGVLMKYKYGNTLCVSTQVGCRMGCRFCASTIGGLIRNLSAGEILSEVLVVNAKEGTDKARGVTNVVLMGSGEPLDNYDNVVKFIRLLSDGKGINVSPRNISLSTCGLVPNIYRLADTLLPINLTVSLHNPFDEKRKEIMPVANKYSVAEILSACDCFFEKTGRRFYFEYSLIDGRNDTEECARELARLLKGRPCHLNLIRLNSVKEKNLNGTSEKQAFEFLKRLEALGLSVTMRRRMGADIDGACGQLRRSFLNDEQ